MPRRDGIMTTSFLGWRFWESGTLCFFRPTASTFSPFFLIFVSLLAALHEHRSPERSRWDRDRWCAL